MKNLKVLLMVLVTFLAQPSATHLAYGQTLSYTISITAPFTDQNELVNAPVAGAGTTTGAVDKTFYVTLGIVNQPRSSKGMAFDFKSPGSWNGNTANLVALGAGSVKAYFENNSSILASSTQTIVGIN